MPKPHGTYLNIQRHQSSIARSGKNKNIYTSARVTAIDEFQLHLASISAEYLDSCYRGIAELANRIKSGEMMSLEDQERELVSQVLKEVTGMLEKCRNIKY